MRALPPFPVDDETLVLVRLAVEHGSLMTLLELLSGYDDRNVVRSVNDADPDEYRGTIYHWRDVILALIDEVERLRETPRRRRWPRRGRSDR